MTKLKIICDPCPYNGECCVYGVDLVNNEHVLIKEIYGDEAIMFADGYRTSIINGRCFFLNDGKCSIHDKIYYPKVCKLYPYEDLDGGEYKSEHVCPCIKDTIL
jgi:Fe-S-cluster containining protein